MTRIVKELLEESTQEARQPSPQEEARQPSPQEPRQLSAQEPHQFSGQGPPQDSTQELRGRRNNEKSRAKIYESRTLWTETEDKEFWREFNNFSFNDNIQRKIRFKI
jgi:hypothetical protein